MRLGLAVLTALTVATPALAQPRALTIDDLYDPQKRIMAATDLHGELLLLHGVIDDDVHLQNPMAFSCELQKAGRTSR
jgi:dipeptidyl aminopeptidase/acylaminoacyl peptidase